MPGIKYQPTWKKHEEKLHADSTQEALKAAEAFEGERLHELQTDSQARRWEKSRKETLAKEKPQWVKHQRKQNETPDPVLKFKKFGFFETDFNPTSGYLLVKDEVKTETETASGLIIQTEEVVQNTGTVIKIGKKIVVNDKCSLPCPCKVGDQILFKRGAGVELVIKSEKCRLMQFSDVLGVFENED